MRSQRTGARRVPGSVAARNSSEASAFCWQAARLRRNRQMEVVVGLFSKDIKSMEDLFHHMLQDIYYSEKKIVSSLPKMIDKASDNELKEGLAEHLEETREHVARIERVFDMLDQKAKSVDCPAIDGIIKEADQLTGEIEPTTVLDAALIAAAQAVEHYEITRYGTLIAFAKSLGHGEVTNLLQETLDEEADADKKLTALAEAGINSEAVAA